MKRYLGVATLLVSALFFGCSHPQPIYIAPPPPPPSLNYQAIEQQGQHDGFEAAKHDVETGHPPLFDHHPRYRNPPVPPPGFSVYRQGFRRGYEEFLHQGAPPPSQ
jgi:hypothetical protein